MFSQAEKNYFIDIVLLIIGVTCLVTGIAIDLKPSFLLALAAPSKLKFLHIWSGYLFTGLIVLHLLHHVQWIRHMSKGIQAIKNKGRIALALAVLSVFLCAALVTVAPSGRAPQKNPVVPGIHGVKQN